MNIVELLCLLILVGMVIVFCGLCGRFFGTFGYVAGFIAATVAIGSGLTWLNRRSYK